MLQNLYSPRVINLFWLPIKGKHLHAQPNLNAPPSEQTCSITSSLSHLSRPYSSCSPCILTLQHVCMCSFTQKSGRIWELTVDCTSGYCWALMVSKCHTGKKHWQKLVQDIRGEWFKPWAYQHYAQYWCRHRFYKYHCCIHPLHGDCLQAMKDTPAVTSYFILQVFHSTETSRLFQLNFSFALL